jgi:hypothetical protein
MTELQHSAAVLQGAVADVFVRMGITAKVFATGADNASAVRKAISMMGLLHVSCPAHVCSLVVKAAINAIGEVKDLVKKVRKLAKFAKNSHKMASLIAQSRCVRPLCL